MKTAPLRINRIAPRTSWSVRRPLGLFCLLLGLTGCILPILPGLPLLLIGGRLLGRRDPLIRRALLWSHQSVRRLRGARLPLLRRVGLGLAPQLRRVGRLLIG